VGSYDPTLQTFFLFSATSAPLRLALFLLKIHYNIPEKNMPTQFRLVLVTCPSLPEARKISRSLLQKHLAACINIHTTPVESHYRWKGKLETTREHLLLIKTTTRRLKSLEREILRLHSYETPEFLVLPISGGSPAYLRWLRKNVH
jgi:periplasmic divalent cation tolerance protein